MDIHTAEDVLASQRDTIRYYMELSEEYRDRMLVACAIADELYENLQRLRCTVRELPSQSMVKMYSLKMDFKEL